MMYNEEDNKIVEETANETKEELKVEKNAVQIENNNSNLVEDKKTEEELLDEIESLRAAFHEAFKKRKNLSRIMMAVVLVLIIGAIVCILQKQMVFNLIGYIIAGVTLVGMLIYYFLVKKKLPIDGKEYINNVTKSINQYVFHDDDFSDVKEIPDKKISSMEFSLEKVFSEGIDIGSRNFLTGKYHGHDFEVGEVALYYANNNAKAKQNARQVGFLGKYIVTPNDYKFDGRFVITLKNKDQSKVVDQPTDIEDLSLQKEEDNLLVYGPTDVQLKDVLGTTFLGKLKKIQVESPLLNVNIVVWAGHTSIYLSYDDPVTTLPYDRPFQQQAQLGYRRDFKEIMDILESVK